MFKGIIRIADIILGAFPWQICWETQVEPALLSKTRQEITDLLQLEVSSSGCYSAIP